MWRQPPGPSNARFPLGSSYHYCTQGTGLGPPRSPGNLKERLLRGPASFPLSAVISAFHSSAFLFAESLAGLSGFRQFVFPYCLGRAWVPCTGGLIFFLPVVALKWRQIMQESDTWVILLEPSCCIAQDSRQTAWRAR